MRSGYLDDATRTTPSGDPESAPDPDADLLARLRDGDEDAFAKLVDEWSPVMLRIARTYVASRASAEDAVQDAWLGVVHGLARFEGRSSLRTWVFTILVNRARTRGARDARVVPWSALGSDDMGGPTVDTDRFQGPDGEYPGHWTWAGAPQRWDGCPEGRALAGEALALLEGALDALPPRQRLVVILRDIQELTAEEACAVLGVTLENQRVLLHRGRAALRRVLEDYYRG
jgi:RNA polymerase sigma-70 factor (ECF subfamily)